MFLLKTARTLARRMIPVAGVTAMLLASACEEKKVKEQLYFDDLKPPLGVKATVVADTSLNPESGSSITVIVSVAPGIDRDDLDGLMKSFWRQVKDRSGFRGGAASKIDLRFYPGEAKAKAGGSDWLAQVLRGSPTEEAAFNNRQKLPLVKWARKALGKQPQFSGELKPQLLANPTTLELQVKVPFVVHDGTGAYVDKLSYTRATTEFSSYTRTLFDKIEPLRKVVFEGVHKDKTVIKVWMTREQYQQLDLRQVEEGLGAFQGKFIEPLMSKAMTSKQVEQKVAKERRKVYRETFARLPKEQVMLDRHLE